MLVDNIVASFNHHQATPLQPGNTICVDESIVQWKGFSGQWINDPLPMFMAIDWNPENGCEIQNSAEGTVV